MKKKTEQIFHSYARLDGLPVYRDEFLDEGGFEMIIRVKFPSKIETATGQAYEYYQKKFLEKSERGQFHEQIMANFLLKNMRTFYAVELKDNVKNQVLHFMDKTIKEDEKNRGHLIYKDKELYAARYNSYFKTLYYNAKDFLPLFEKYFSLREEHFEIIFKEWIEKSFAWEVGWIYKKELYKWEIANWSRRDYQKTN